MFHKEEHKYAGKKVGLIEGFEHKQYPDIDHIIVEDWWDRVSGVSWMGAQGNPACLIYAVRTGFASYDIPIDDEVVYGKYNGMGVLVHVNEIEGVLEDDTME